MLIRSGEALCSAVEQQSTWGWKKITALGAAATMTLGGLELYHLNTDLSQEIHTANATVMNRPSTLEQYPFTFADPSDDPSLDRLTQQHPEQCVVAFPGTGETEGENYTRELKKDFELIPDGVPMFYGLYGAKNKPTKGLTKATGYSVERMGLELATDLPAAGCKTINVFSSSGGTPFGIAALINANKRIKDPSQKLTINSFMAVSPTYNILTDSRRGTSFEGNLLKIKEKAHEQFDISPGTPPIGMLADEVINGCGSSLYKPSCWSDHWNKIAHGAPQPLLDQQIDTLMEIRGGDPNNLRRKPPIDKYLINGRTRVLILGASRAACDKIVDTDISIPNYAIYFNSQGVPTDHIDTRYIMTGHAQFYKALDKEPTQQWIREDYVPLDTQDTNDSGPRITAAKRFVLSDYTNPRDPELMAHPCEK